MATKHFGHIDGVPVGAAFPNRTELRASRVHPPLQSGIHGTRADGADSIVASGGYPDDEDHGDVIIYTGAGGNDPQTKRQTEDQTVDQTNNAGLITSMLNGHPVRVTRGAGADSDWAPASGFRYDGLYAVTQYETPQGVDGFRVLLFRLDKLDDDAPGAGPAARADLPMYAMTTVSRRVRDSAQARRVKAWHKNACQVCGVALQIDGDRLYSEGAHIRPLGRPDEGPDVTSNILCLCPNHHAQLDYGGLLIRSDFVVVNRTTGAIIGTLRTDHRHIIDSTHLDHRRNGLAP